MLLNFNFENFKSFKGMQEFFMATSDQSAGAAPKGLDRHEGRLIAVDGLDGKILPITAIFGGNAFGKSNFVEALLLVQFLVLEQAKEGTRIPVNPFFLEPETKKMPTSFELNIFSENTEYHIYIKVDKEKVIEEKVSIVNGECIENIYHRKEIPEINKKFNHDKKISNVLETSRDNTLMLSSQVLQKMEKLKPVYRWFSETLLILSPRVRFWHVDDSSDLAQKIGEGLRLLNTGVESIKLTPVNVNEIQLPREQIEELRKNAKSGTITYFKSQFNNIYMVNFEDGEIAAKSLGITKNDRNLKNFNVNVSEESDGTQRLLCLLPAILQISEPGQSKVLIIDELDRSLHTDMTHALVNYHLNSVSYGSKSQLIFTTHDTNLIDLDILRSDEIWVIQNHRGESELVCLAEFPFHEATASFQELYRAHNLGGTPRIQLSSHKQLAQLIASRQPEAQSGS